MAGQASSEAASERDIVHACGKQGRISTQSKEMFNYFCLNDNQ